MKTIASTLSKRVFYTVFCLWFMVLVSSCTNQQFSASFPYAVLVGKYRSYQTAQNNVARLQEKGLDPYVHVLKVPQEGAWHGVFLGGTASIEEAMALKIDYEDRFGLQHLQIVNFNQLKASLQEVVWVPEHEKIEAKEPDLPAALRKLAASLPYHPSFQIAHFSFFQPLKGVSFQDFPELRNTNPDLPRGISTSQLLALSTGFVEAVYDDPLRKKQLTVNLAYLRKGAIRADSLAFKLAHEILDTRYYDTEEIADTEVEAEEGRWKGYMVTISPRKNTLKRYLILANKQKDMLCFIQASSDSANEMLFFAEHLESDDTIQDYPNVFNSLHLLAANRPVNETLAHLEMDILEEMKGKAGGFFNGNSRSIYLFYHPNDGLWEARFTFFEEAQLSEQLYKSVFGATSKKEDAISQEGLKGKITYSSKRGKKAALPEEIQLHSAHFLGYISNGKKSELDKQDLLLRTRCFQLTAPQQEPDWFTRLSRM